MVYTVLRLATPSLAPRKPPLNLVLGAISVFSFEGTWVALFSSEELRTYRLSDDRAHSTNLEHQQRLGNKVGSPKRATNAIRSLSIWVIRFALQQRALA